MEFNKEKWKEKLEERLLEKFSVSLKDASPFEVYRALGETVMSFIAKDWYKTKEEYSKTKQAFYLSSEFLMGRALGNNLINLGIDKEIKEFLEELGIDYNQVEDEEEDAALGNGGLGRLAACFMDSLATLNLPGQGYSIRYRNGIFNQYLRDGYQVEKPETWLKYGDVWSVMRPEDEVIVNFGHTSVRALPYDMPIIGYGTNNVNTLRLWEAHSIVDLDLGVFNQQDYLHATQDKTLAEDISRVLYPNDSTDEGKKLRLRQQYFFVSASLQDIIKKFKKVHGREFSKIPEYIAIQLNDTHPDKPCVERMLYAEGQIIRREHVSDVSCAVSSKDSEGRTEYNQERHHRYQTQYFRQNQIVCRVHSHDIEGVNLLRYAHCSQF